MKKADRVAFVAVLLFFTFLGPIFADSPSVEDAHEYLGEVLNAGGVRIQNDQLVLDYSRNGECGSRIEYRDEDLMGKYIINWSDITSEGVGSDSRSIWIHGAIAWQNDDGRGVNQNFHFDVPDRITAKRFLNAIKLLILSCSSKSKFD